MPALLRGIAPMAMLAVLSAHPARSQEPPPPPPALADDAEMEKLLEELQAEEQKNAPPPAPSSSIPDLSKINLGAGLPGIASLNPDIAVIFDGAAAAFGAARSSKPGSPLGDDPLQTGGHDAATSGFTLRQVELSIGANVDPYLRFDSNIVFKEGVEVEEAYATTLGLPLSLQVRAGGFLSKFGRQNEQHPHAWWFVSQPLVYGQVMGEDNQRGLGVELSWLSPLPWSLMVIGSAQSSVGACCSRTFSPLPDTPIDVDSPLDLVATAAVEQFFPITDDLSVLWGVSAQTGPTPYIDDGARGEIWGTDLLVRYKPPASASRMFVELQTEGMLRTRHPGQGDFVDDAIVDGGAFAQLVFHPDAQLGTGLRYDFVDGDPGDVAGAGLGHNTQRGSVIFEYAPTHFSRLMAEASAGTRGQGDLLWGAMLNLEVSIGAHGAHAF